VIFSAIPIYPIFISRFPKRGYRSVGSGRRTDSVRWLFMRLRLQRLVFQWLIMKSYVDIDECRRRRGDVWAAVSPLSAEQRTAVAAVMPTSSSRLQRRCQCHRPITPSNRCPPVPPGDTSLKWLVDPLRSRTHATWTFRRPHAVLCVRITRGAWSYN